MVLVALPPRAIFRVFGAACRAKFPSAFTVRLIVVVALRPPEVPVIVIVAVPTFAVAPAVMVNTLEDSAGFCPNEAVTPFGSFESASVTAPENPFTGVILIVLVAFPTPCTSVTALGAADNVKV